MAEFISLIIGTSLTTVIAFFVFFRNYRSATNQLFVGLAGGIIGWSLTTYFSLHTTTATDTLFWIRLVMLFVVIQNTCFFLLVQVFPSKSYKPLKNKRSIVAIVYAFITAIVSISPYLFVNFEHDVPVPGSGMVLFLPHALIFAVGGLLILTLRYHRAQSIEKAQFRYILAGTILMFTVVPIGNFILPVIFKFTHFVVFSPLYSIVFSALIAYGIITQKMFDIRIFLRKAFVIGGALISTLLFLSGLLSFNVYVLNSFIHSNLLLPLFSLLAIVLFSFLQKLFLVFANKYFFTTLYDRQKVTEEIAAKMSQTLVLDEILTIISSKLTHVLGVEQYAFATCEYTKNKACYLEQNSNINLNNIHKVLSRQGVLDYFEKTSDVVVCEEIIHFIEEEVLRPKKTTVGDRKALLKFKDDLEGANIAVCVPMVSNNKLISLLLLGDKLSKDAYTVEDIQLLETVSDQAAVAIQNARLYKASQEFNVKLRAEIEKATKELSAANTHLKELDTAKSEFVSIASHQLRTPLTGIMGYLSMLVDGDFGKIEPTQLKILQDVFGASNRLIRIVNIFLNVSRIEAGRFYLDYKQVSFESVVDEIIMELRPTATKKGITLETDPSIKAMTQITVDPDKMKDVVLNLVDNAIKYSQSGTISVSAKKEGTQLHCLVHDQGVGINPEEAKRLFSKFVRGTGIARVQPNGSGLGLFIAKKVVEEHGGKIWVESEGEGKGSTFQFVIPLKPTQEQIDLQAKIASRVTKQKAQAAQEAASETKAS